MSPVKGSSEKLSTEENTRQNARHLQRLNDANIQGTVSCKYMHHLTSEDLSLANTFEPRSKNLKAKVFKKRKSSKKLIQENSLDEDDEYGQDSIKTQTLPEPEAGQISSVRSSRQPLHQPAPAVSTRPVIHENDLHDRAVPGEDRNLDQSKAPDENMTKVHRLRETIADKDTELYNLRDMVKTLLDEKEELEHEN
ncbi:hypothetical protein FDECE_13233 [Fusarium decemcellulare]|nr:hypothetical protein FDECE_13233 [Fusarium decemcellulare]